MKKNNYSIILPSFFFISTYIFTHSVTNLFYKSTFGPDYLKYKQFIDYFQGLRESPDLEQGLGYYYLISSMIELNSKKDIFRDLDSLYSFSIQSANLIIYTFGLIGFYLLLKNFNTKASTNLMVLGLLNIFPPAIGLRLTMKPEILALCLLPWCILFIEKYLISKKKLYLIEFLILFSFLFTLKISISAMIILFFLIKYFKSWIKTDNRDKLIVLILFLLFTSALLIENYNANDNFITQAEHDEKYNNKASLSVPVKLNPLLLFKEPYQPSQRDSMIGIFLLDTFDDYFNLYWNYDQSNFSKYRKNFINTTDNSSKLFSLDLNNRTIYYSGPFGFYLNFFRQYFAITMSVIFYYLIYKFYKQRTEIRLFILSPIIGVVVLIINNVLGIPKNNFDPLRGDTFKTFYIAIFLCLCFVFLVSLFLKEMTKNKVLAIGIYSLLIIFIMGFPKANNDELDFSLSINNQYSIFCEINKPFLANSLFDTSNLKCNDIKSYSSEVQNVDVENIPFINLFFIYLCLTVILRNLIAEIRKYFINSNFF
jgi:hypothetical protein